MRNMTMCRHGVGAGAAHGNRGGVVVRERGGAGDEEKYGVRECGRRDWKMRFLWVPGRPTVVSRKRCVCVCALEALHSPGLAWRRWRRSDEGKEKRKGFSGYVRKRCAGEREPEREREKKKVGVA